MLLWGRDSVTLVPPSAGTEPGAASILWGQDAAPVLWGLGAKRVIQEDSGMMRDRH